MYRVEYQIAFSLLSVDRVTIIGKFTKHIGLYGVAPSQNDVIVYRM